MIRMEIFDIIKIFIFLVLVVLSYKLLDTSEKEKVIQKSIKNTFDVTKEMADARIKEETRKRYEDGNQEKVSFMYSLDLKMVQSGISKKFPFMTTEFYLLSTLVFGLVSFIFIQSITGVWIFGLFAMLLVCFISYLALYILSNMAYVKVERNIVSFANCIQNFSKSSDDIVSIFRKTVPYLNEPLKTHVQEFCHECRYTGDKYTAFKNLELKIEHPKFKELVRNLEICSRLEADYGVIIEDTRGVIRDYLNAKEERKAIIKNGRFELLLVLTICAVVVFLFDGFVSGSILSLLLNDIIGNGILVYCIIVLFWTFWTMISFDKGED